MRVVAGRYGGRRLRAPGGNATRPTSDRVREAVFDILASLGLPEGARVADLFAGSGALGIEALSRGAAHVSFVDQRRSAVEMVKANLDDLGIEKADARVCHADAVRWAAGAASGISGLDLVLADPPYDWKEWAGLLSSLEQLAPLMVAETRDRWNDVAGWETVRQRRYGSTLVTIARVARRGGQVKR